MSKAKAVKVVALVERDGRVELFAPSGESLGQWVRLDVRTARQRRAVERELSADALAVAAAIAKRALHAPAGIVTVSDAELAAETHLSPKTIFVGRIALRRAGLLRWERRQRSGNAYQLQWPFGRRQRRRAAATEQRPR